MLSTLSMFLAQEDGFGSTQTAFGCPIKELSTLLTGHKTESCV
jgi:hypothetical protein